MASKPPLQNVPPLNWSTPIVNLRDGTASQMFRRWWQDLFGNGNALAGSEIKAGTGIEITPDGFLINNPEISADIQALLDTISDVHGTVLYRGASAWNGLAPGTAGYFLKTNGAAADPAWALAGGGLIGIQTITATGAGTYTPTTGTGSIVIELIGGGGGGQGVASPGGANAQPGIAGGGGAYLRKRLTSNFSGASYSVGTGGSGGAAGDNVGTAGNDTTFTSTGGSPVVYTAAGGAGALVLTAAGTPRMGNSSAGGTATNGDINMDGGPSLTGMALSTAALLGGAGGPSFYGRGSSPVRLGTANSSAAGSNGVGYGSGGGGAGALGTGIARAGGNGSNGLLIIWEYA